MKIFQIMLILLLTVATSYVTVRFLTPSKSNNFIVEKENKTTFDRVMKTQTIRCGYVISHPFLFRDANTGVLSGIAHDTIEKMAENLNLKVEWAEEVGWSSMLEGFSTNRYDMLCSSIWSTSNRGLKADFLKPLSYAGVHAWVRPDDERFTNKKLSEIDWGKLTVSTIDGHISDIILRLKFANAKRLSLPDTSSISENFLAVSNGKADVTFEENYIALEFLSKNPRTLVRATKDKPIKVFPTTFLIPQGELKLKSMLNAAQDELMNSGYISELISKYDQYPGSFYRVAKPYETEK